MNGKSEMINYIIDGEACFSTCTSFRNLDWIITLYVTQR